MEEFNENGQKNKKGKNKLWKELPLLSVYPKKFQEIISEGLRNYLFLTSPKKKNMLVKEYTI